MDTDRRIQGNRLVGNEREEAIKQVVELRNEGLSWSDIAQTVGVASPGTVRRLYAEAGFDFHHLLPGKGGRTVTWEEGDWCDSRCMGAHPQSACECKCDGVNHSGGPGQASEILREKGLTEDELKERVDQVAQTWEFNRERFEKTGEAKE